MISRSLLSKERLEQLGSLVVGGAFLAPLMYAFLSPTLTVEVYGWFALGAMVVSGALFWFVFRFLLPDDNSPLLLVFLGGCVIVGSGLLIRHAWLIGHGLLVTINLCAFLSLFGASLIYKTLLRFKVQGVSSQDVYLLCLFFIGVATLAQLIFIWGEVNLGAKLFMAFLFFACFAIAHYAREHTQKLSA